MAKKLSDTAIGELPADVLLRIADALERLIPPTPAALDFAQADAFIWHPSGRHLTPVARVNRVEMFLLKGIDRMRDILVENTERFARGLPANNALLWARAAWASRHWSRPFMRTSTPRSARRPDCSS